MPRRSFWSDRLLDFPGLAFGDGREFEQRGGWLAHFAARMGRPVSDLTLEVGCSGGALLCEVARDHPEAAFVGLDWKPRMIHDAARRAAELGLTNIAFLWGRAQLLDRIFAPGEVDEAWIFHPEPCDRPHELPNRLLGEPFLTTLSAVLRPGGPVHLKTDHPGYFQHILAILGLPEPEGFRIGPGGRMKRRELVEPATLPAKSDEVLRQFVVSHVSGDYWQGAAGPASRRFAGRRTLYESRFTSRGLPIYYLELARRVREGMAGLS